MTSAVVARKKDQDDNLTEKTPWDRVFSDQTYLKALEKDKFGIYLFGKDLERFDSDFDGQDTLTVGLALQWPPGTAKVNRRQLFSAVRVRNSIGVPNETRLEGQIDLHFGGAIGNWPSMRKVTLQKIWTEVEGEQQTPVLSYAAAEPSTTTTEPNATTTEPSATTTEPNATTTKPGYAVVKESHSASQCTAKIGEYASYVISKCTCGRATKAREMSIKANGEDMSERVRR